MRAQVRPMSLDDYVSQSNLRFHINGTLIRSSTQLNLRRFTGSKGAGTYLDYGGALEPATGNVENVPFYGRCE